MDRCVVDGKEEILLHGTENEESQMDEAAGIRGTSAAEKIEDLKNIRIFLYLLFCTEKRIHFIYYFVCVFPFCFLVKNLQTDDL